MGAFDDYLAGTSVSEEQNIVQQPEPIEFGTYSQNDLTSDRYFGTVRDYMETRFGVDEFRGDSRKEVVNKYLSCISYQNQFHSCKNI